MSIKDHDLEEVEQKGNNVLTTKVTTNQSEFKEAPMEEDDPNESGDKLNDSVNCTLAMALEPDFEKELANIKSVPSSKISKGNTILINQKIFFPIVKLQKLNKFIN